MKLKKMFLVNALLISGVVGFQQTSQAATVNSTDSDATIDYIKNEGPTGPTHPVKPGPVEPDPLNPPTGNVGDLTIDYVSNISFGKNQIANNDRVYTAGLSRVFVNGVAEPVPNSVQITDNRGNLAGWSLKVKQNGAFKSGTAELTNTTMTLKNGVSKSDNTLNPTFAPSTKETSLNATNGYQEIISANANQGMGTWNTRFGKDNAEGLTSIELAVPWNSAKTEGSYTTSLTWELGNTPN